MPTINRNDTKPQTITAPQDWFTVLDQYLMDLCQGPQEHFGMVINGMLDEDKYYKAIGQFMRCLAQYTSFVSHGGELPVKYRYDNYFDDDGKPKGYFGILMYSQGGYTAMVMVRDDLTVSGHS